jgi:hypothetical protein
MNNRKARPIEKISTYGCEYDYNKNLLFCQLKTLVSLGVTLVLP